MPNRPIGDETDQLLRRSMANLAEYAGPTPNLESLTSNMSLEPTPQPITRRRPALVLTAAAVAIVLVVALALLYRTDAAIDLEVVDDLTISFSVGGSSTVTCTSASRVISSLRRVVFCGLTSM